jgi:hypothetical protein
LILNNPNPFNGTTNTATNNAHPIIANAPTNYNPNYLAPNPCKSPEFKLKNPTAITPNNPGPLKLIIIIRNELLMFMQDHQHEIS